MAHCERGKSTTTTTMTLTRPVVERITEMIPKPPIEYKRRARYVSKHANRIRVEAACWKSNHRSFGIPKLFLKPPSQYLKKKSRIEPCIILKHIHPRRMAFRTELPTRIPTKKIIHDPLTTLPQDPLALGQVNFRKRNVCNAKKLKPPHLTPKYVDTRFGDKHNFCSSGLVPVYTFGKNYGKLPEVFKRTKHSRDASDSNNATEQDAVNKTLNGRAAHVGDKQRRRKGSQSSCYPVTEAERRTLLDGMKKKWNETMKRFGCLPFLTDTLPKAQRKMRMERELDALEKDIAFIERHPYMYICGDGDHSGSQRQDSPRS